PWTIGKLHTWYVTQQDSEPTRAGLSVSLPRRSAGRKRIRPPTKCSNVHAKVIPLKFPSFPLSPGISIALIFSLLLLFSLLLFVCRLLIFFEVPQNTHIARNLQISESRRHDETKNGWPGGADAHAEHGRECGCRGVGRVLPALLGTVPVHVPN